MGDWIPKWKIKETDTRKTVLLLFLLEQATTAFCYLVYSSTLQRSYAEGYASGKEKLMIMQIMQGDISSNHGKETWGRISDPKLDAKMNRFGAHHLRGNDDFIGVYSFLDF